DARHGEPGVARRGDRPFPPRLLELARVQPHVPDAGAAPELEVLVEPPFPTADRAHRDAAVHGYQPENVGRRPSRPAANDSAASAVLSATSCASASSCNATAKLASSDRLSSTLARPSACVGPSAR